MAGTTDISAFFSNVAISGQPALTINSQTVNSILSGGSWFITPNAQPTSGSYAVTLNAPIGTSNANNYYILKRLDNNSFYAWTNQGTNVASTINGGVVTASANGITSFSQFGIGEGFGQLPVKLIKFLASDDAKSAKLHWETASELNNDKFIIERSDDTGIFTAIGEVKGSGNSAKLLSYNFKDYTPLKGVNYYRLKQLDFNGDFEYSEVRAVNFDLESSVFNVYPNPVIDVINFSETVETVAIYNLQGILLLKQSGSISSIRIPNNLGAGLYLLKLKLADGSVITKQIIVNR